jgi:hypothetical protein
VPVTRLVRQIHRVVYVLDAVLAVAAVYGNSDVMCSNYLDFKFPVSHSENACIVLLSFSTNISANDLHNEVTNYKASDSQANNVNSARYVAMGTTLYVIPYPVSY